MQFIVNGVEYPATTIDKVTGALALELTRQAKFGVKTLARLLGETSRLGYDTSGVVVALPEDHPDIVGAELLTESEQHFRALLAFIWLARWQSGDRVSFAESTDFPLMSLEIVMDEDEAQEVDEDPTSPSLASPPVLPAPASDGNDGT